MREPERCAICKGVAEKTFDASVDAVARHLRGQGKIDSLVMARRDELLRGEQSRLGLAAAHWPFNHDDTGLEGRSSHCFLNLVWRKGGASCPKGGGETRLPKLAARPADLAQCVARPGSSGLQRKSFLGREPSFVRANPVRNGDETREQPEVGVIGCKAWIGGSNRQWAEDRLEFGH